MSNSNLIIGPLQYTHVVQKITVNEQKAVEVLRTTRSNKNFIIDSGESVQKASIQFLFSGLDQINTGLRPLIALFKICPFTSIKNELLSSSWKKVDQFYDEENLQKLNKFIEKNNKAFKNITNTVAEGTLYKDLIIKDLRLMTNVLNQMGVYTSTDPSPNGQLLGVVSALPLTLKKNRIYSDYIPVALESLSIQTVEDMPESISVNVIVSRIDTEPITGPELLYQGRGVNDHDPDPTTAYWLKKWIDNVLKTNIIPLIHAEDFRDITITWYGQTLSGEPLQSQTDSNARFDKNKLVFNSSSTTKVLAESCSIQNFFGYQKLIGKGTHTAQHVGSSGRDYSIDLLFNTQRSSAEYKSFCSFKETSDEIIRSVDRLNRVNGWYIESPVTKLFGLSRSPAGVLNRTVHGIYVPTDVNIESGDIPNTKIVRVDLAENDINFLNNKEGVIVSGGNNIPELKKFYQEVVLTGEQNFRASIVLAKISAAISGKAVKSIETNSADQEMFKLFWPITKTISEISATETLGLLNIDTIRAVFAGDEAVKTALQNSPLAVGKLVVGNTNPTLWDRTKEAADQLTQAFRGINQPAVATAVEAAVNRYFSGLVQSEIDDLVTSITVSLFGDADSFGFDSLLSRASAKAITTLIKSNVVFNKGFTDKLFDVIIYRKNPPSITPHIYDVAGLHSAFYKLSTEYILYIDAHPTYAPTKEVLSRNLNASIYEDLLLPSYYQLFGDDWEQFAPTYDDLGIINWSSSGGLKQEDARLLQSQIATTREDTVEPHIFFFSTKYKSELRSALQAGTDISSLVSHTLSLSIPFNTKEITGIKSILDKRVKEGDPNFGKEALTEIIKPVLLRHKAERSDSFEEDIEILRKAAATRYEELLKEGGVKIFFHHNDNIMVPYKLTLPGLGGELYRVAKELDLLNKTQYPELKPMIDNESGYRSASAESETLFMRNLDDNSKAAIKSSVDQIPDDYRSAAKLFPAAKVYLIDRRGNDIIVDDIIANIGNILSIDITIDKEDADLAIIKIADPLFALQNSSFPSGNVMSSVNSKGDSTLDTVFANTRGDQGITKRLKISQGRPIQIRMGYSSLAKNLPIIFTGKITEVVPGEVLTIVAQGWKAELISRPVTFVNKNPKNWGAKDLAVQAIQEAAPFGIGDWIPQNSANYLLQAISRLDSADMINHIFDVGSDVEQQKGSRGYLKSIGNYIITSAGGRSLNQDDLGIDTRLKNIWYPDTAAFNNWFNIRSTFNFTPAYLNDGWVIPLQPAWNVLKEASRHAWNCIVQVVPYDTEATLFFGHPDQPYYWTRGESVVKSRWRKYAERISKQNDITLQQVQENFLNSKLYNDGIESLNIEERKLETGILFAYVYKYSIPGKGDVSNLTYTDFGSFTTFKNDYTKYSVSRTPFGTGANGVEIYNRVKARLKENTAPLLIALFLGVDPNNVISSWPSVEQDLTALLDNNTSSIDSGIESRVGNLKNGEATELTIESLKSLTQRLYNIIAGLGSGNYKGEDVSNIANSMLSLLDQMYVRVDNSAFKIAVINYKNYISSNFLTKTTEQLLKKAPLTGTRAYLEYSISIRDTNLDYISKITATFGDNSVRKSIIKSGTVSMYESISNNKEIFKGLLYFFDRFLAETTDGLLATDALTKKYENVMSPTLRTFRVHHWIDSDTDIIQNSITATTNEMWNTSVIEHPAQSTASSTVVEEGSLSQTNKYYSAVKWNYYPKQEVSGVIGLQFNPGLTLANKKINIATELNCHSEELSAKLACVDLAEGIKKMYRGNLAIRGRNIKPYDRIILNDKYNDMVGPVEVESVIHHWNPSQGWVTNITPCAVCDANPGAAILQTAVLEAAYRRVFNLIDWATDAITLGLVIGSLGGGLAARGSSGIISTGLKNIVKELSQGGTSLLLKNTAGRTWAGAKVLGKDVLLAGGINPLKTLGLLFSETGGLTTALASNYLLSSIADGLTHTAFKLHVIPSFVDSARKAKQLPVILSPLLFNGIPFTAGLETDDSLYSIFANDIFYSFKSIQVAANQLLNEIAGTDKISLIR